MNRFYALVLSLILVPIAAAQGYNVIDLGPMSPAAINAQGEVAGNLNGQSYVWTQAGGLQSLGLLPGGTFSIAAGINDLGVVAGTADGPGIQAGGDFGNTSCDDIIEPVTWTKKNGFATAASIPEVSPALEQSIFPCLQADYAYGLNNAGQVVGSNASFDSYKYGFQWSGKNAASIIIDGWQSAAAAINNQGVVAGRTSEELPLSYESMAAVYLNGTTANIGSLVSSESLITVCSAAMGLNDLNQVVGWSTTVAAPDPQPCADMFSGAMPIHAFLWNPGQGMNDLGTLPGDKSSIALKVNVWGVVIGESGKSISQINPPFGDEFTPGITGHPFMWSRFTGMRNLNDFVSPRSGWLLQTAVDINMWGQVVGTGLHNGEVHGYLLTPSILLQF